MFAPTQISPAFDWHAVYAESDDSFVLIPLVCWALGLDNGQTMINGMVSDNGVIVPANSVRNFKGYDVNVMEDLEMEDHEGSIN